MGKNNRKAPDDRPRLAEGRREAILEVLQAQRAITVAEIESRFAVSPMTARRDLAELERQGHARRTHGGAVLPSSSSHEDSFSARMATATAAKRALAVAAAETVEDGEALFLDSSTTAYHLTEVLIRDDRAVTVVTNSLPIIDLLSSNARETIELIVAGGQLRRISRSFVGPLAVEAIKRHWTDRAFLSVKGIAPDGTLTDADPLEAEVKRTMISQATTATLLVDGGKLDRRGLSVIGPVSTCSDVLVAGLPAGSDLISAIDVPGVAVRQLDAGEAPTPEEATA
ncbi:DeoR/GlpR family DNA-binding transcription regulator [Patulibacter sp.]|uniref:DeoR/GlpR family DNA-binding transcription regulator n=1 Tax=Patulibacter sp. TaxID=1912859 RepID=UPI002724D3EA|nr:DeoR/GlpR family DNA-binding transcription regulator [Patulibacter sp.]MDO9407456.1 DeoR/GlpR family DNA-binding transcription regulator [Patulibacter sp.]